MLESHLALMDEAETVNGWTRSPRVSSMCSWCVLYASQSAWRPHKVSWDVRCRPLCGRKTRDKMSFSEVTDGTFVTRIEVTGAVAT